MGLERSRGGVEKGVEDGRNRVGKKCGDVKVLAKNSIVRRAGGESSHSFYSSHPIQMLQKKTKSDIFKKNTQYPTYLPTV